MKADLDGEMRRIAAFLDIEIAEDVWPGLVSAAGFDFMRANGATLMPRAATSWDKGHERFINEGRNERWREVLTPEDIARYEARAARELSPALANWLAKGRLIAGDPRQAAD
jgi:aryl sulfotransferase